MASRVSQSITIRVLNASTGVTYKISLLPSDLTVANIRAHLAAAIPPSDQILLLGPPFKVPKDSTLQSEEVLSSLRAGDLEDDPVSEETGSTETSTTTTTKTTTTQTTPTTTSTPTSTNILSSTERTGARRLFLFSKQSLSQSAPDPPPCQLQPPTQELPTDAPGPSPLNMALDSNAAHSDPLHQALTAYERQFMLYLAQGRVLADNSDLRFGACRTCIQEQAIMARALRAAVSNLSDHYSGATRTRNEFVSTFTAKTAAHDSLLQRFDSILTNLANIQLDPSLVTVARTSGRTMQTLIDTVPVKEERDWKQQCQTSHQNLLALFADLNTAFSQLGTPASREDEIKQDLVAEQEIQALWTKVEGTIKQIRDRQAQRVERLTSDHGHVVQLIMKAISAESDGGHEVQSAFGPLKDLSNSSKQIIPSMLEEDKAMLEFMQEVGEAKTRAMRRMKSRLREVSIAQSSIQRVLSSVAVLRDALTQQCANMQYLEHVAELPDAYRDFLSEVRRRRAYGEAVTSSSTAMMERLASMRSDEVKARERFLRGPGRHLMPPFYDIFVPTLATPPPLFTPQLPAMVELDTLPDCGISGSGTETRGEIQSGAEAGGENRTTVPATGADGGETSSDTMMQGTEQAGVSSASTLTAESQQQQQQKMSATSTRTDEGMITSTVAGTSTAQEVPQQEQLIVSADEHSSNDLIMDPAGGAEQDAERKTLAYENAVLRQALERMGGKTPQAYIEEAQTADNLKDNDNLREDLAKAKQELEAANAELQKLQKERKVSDKISHSSFSVGDVGLFMPTGRGSGGKRTYLAFHTSCPHRYLSTDCVEGTPDFVLGRIVYQEELVAGEIGTDANPYGLHVGTKFWVLTVEVLNASPTVTTTS